MKTFITTNARQTKELGEMLAQEIKGGEIICLEGELGSGKTIFTQGFLKGLGIEGPYTSPTFVVMKQYTRKLSGKNNREKQSIYHIDAYRVDSKNVLKLGWEEITADKNNVIIIEWANKIRKIIPKNSLWVKFKWKNENKREVSILNN